MRDTIVVCGSVKAKEYGHVRRLMNRAGVKPRVVRIDLAPLIKKELAFTGPRDRQNEISPGEDRYNYERDFVKDVLWNLSHEHPGTTGRAIVFMYRESDFDRTRLSELYELSSRFQCSLVDLDNRPSLLSFYRKLAQGAR